MVRINSVAKGLANYIDTEILPKMGGWQRWVVGSAAGIALKRADRLITALADHPLIKAMGIIDSEGLVDLDLIYEEFARQAAKGPAVIDITMNNELRLTAEDVDKIYRAIMSVDGQ